jgi:hypothetical protein
MVQPTATQAENDLAAHGQTVMSKVADGSPLDPYTPTWLQVAPTNVSVPVISGANPPVVGSVLSTSNGIWNYGAGLSFAYQWMRTGTPIAGATSKTYTTATADKTFTMSCRVTATNSKGSAQATSAATVAVP